MFTREINRHNNRFIVAIATARTANTKKRDAVKTGLLSLKIITCVGETRETKETQKR